MHMYEALRLFIKRKADLEEGYICKLVRVLGCVKNKQMLLKMKWKGFIIYFST